MHPAYPPRCDTSVRASAAYHLQGTVTVASPVDGAPLPHPAVQTIPVARTQPARTGRSGASHQLANAGYHVSVLTTTDLDVLIADTEAEMARVIAAAEDERTTRALRLGALPPGPGRRGEPWQAPAAAAGPAGLPVDRGRAPARAAGRRGRGDGPQLQPRPRRHPGCERGAPPSPGALDDDRRAPGHQHRRHAVHAVADGAPPPVGPGLQRPEGARPHAPLRRDLPRAVRGPVPGHPGLRARRVDVGRLLLRHDRPQDRRAHRRLGAGGRHAGHRRRVGHRARTAASAGRWAWPSSSTTTCWASGATSRRPARGLRHRGAQEDAAAHPRAGARRRGGPHAAARDPRTVQPPLGRGGRGGARHPGARRLARVHPRTRPRTIATRRCASSSRSGVVDGEAMERLQRIVGSVIAA